MQIGTKQIVVNGQTVTVRVFAAKTERKPRPRQYEPNEDTLHAMRLDAVRMPYGE